MGIRIGIGIVSPLRPRMRWLFSLFCVCALAAHAQPPQTLAPSPLAFSLDSLQRMITARLLSDADKKEIRACGREKAQALKLCRESDPAHAQTDRKLNEAKLGGGTPDDPAIQALLEKKFALEKSCDDAFNAQARGKQCLAGEAKRRQALQKALQQDKQYQALLKKTQTTGAETL